MLYHGSYDGRGVRSLEGGHKLLLLYLWKTFFALLNFAQQVRNTPR